jgi:membrane-bound lytic murein transglycosylase A
MSAHAQRVISYVFLFAALFVMGCSISKGVVSRPGDALVPVRSCLPVFLDDMDRGSLKTVIERNLVYLNRINPETVFQYGPDAYTCKEVIESQKSFLNLISQDIEKNQLNKQIREQFKVYRATGQSGDEHVLFTGYFEPILDASLTPDETFKYPLYGLPQDLVTIDLSLFGEKFKGQRIIARIEGMGVLPYYNRQEIDVGKVLEGRNLEIAWLRDPVDVAFLQIQGSGQLRLNHGEILRVGYSAANGRPYRSLGGYMIQKGYLEQSQVSMQAIRKYLSEHAEVRDEVLNSNPSYVFFRVIEGEPVGNINVPLVPGRSLALDSAMFPKGALAFISCRKPVMDDEGGIKEWIPFSRFVMNQDTGGAIKGAGRADLFWGAGPYAETAAGNMKHEGELYLLIKKKK